MDRSAAEMRPPAEDSATATVSPRATSRAATEAARDASRSGTPPTIAQDAPAACPLTATGAAREKRRTREAGGHGRAKPGRPCQVKNRDWRSAREAPHVRFRRARAGDSPGARARSRIATGAAREKHRTRDSGGDGGGEAPGARAGQEQRPAQAG